MRDMGNERKAPHRFWGEETSVVARSCADARALFVGNVDFWTLSFTETSPLVIWPEAPVLMKTPARLLPVSTVWKLHCRRSTSRYMPTTEAMNEID